MTSASADPAAHVDDRNVVRCVLDPEEPAIFGSGRVRTLAAADKSAQVWVRTQALGARPSKTRLDPRCRRCCRCCRCCRPYAPRAPRPLSGGLDSVRASHAEPLPMRALGGDLDGNHHAPNTANAADEAFERFSKQRRPRRRWTSCCARARHASAARSVGAAWSDVGGWSSRSQAQRWQGGRRRCRCS